MDVKNFYLIKSVFDLNDLMNNPSLYIGGFNNISMVDVVKKDRNQYIEDGLLVLEGGIIFNINGKKIGGLPLFDDLTSLYAYYLNAVEEFMEDDIVNFYYPSQPVEVRLERVKNGQTTILIDDQCATVNTDPLLRSILSSSEVFFELLVDELKLNKYQYELKQIDRIKKNFKRNN